MKPRLFIGSSKEGVSIAYAVQSNLDEVAQVTVWTQGVFGLSTTTLEDLLGRVKSSDFGVFIFSPDDVTRMRGRESQSVRDNVLVELGLFVSRLGKERCYILRPKDAADLHLPTDLIGVAPATYEEHDDGNWEAATGQACFKISTQVKRLGPFPKEGPETEREDISSRLAEVETRLNSGMEEMSRRFASLEQALKTNLALSKAAQPSGGERELVEHLGEVGKNVSEMRSLYERVLPELRVISAKLEEVHDRLIRLEKTPGGLNKTTPSGPPASPAEGALNLNDRRWIGGAILVVVMALLLAAIYWLRG